MVCMLVSPPLNSVKTTITAARTVSDHPAECMLPYGMRLVMLQRELPSSAARDRSASAQPRDMKRAVANVIHQLRTQNEEVQRQMDGKTQRYLDCQAQLLVVSSCSLLFACVFLVSCVCASCVFLLYVEECCLKRERETQRRRKRRPAWHLPCAPDNSILRENCGAARTWCGGVTDENRVYAGEQTHHQ